MNSEIKITKIIPQGFCSGVIEAWSSAKNIAKNNLNNKKIYMIGWLVHNKKIVEELESIGILTINDEKKNRIEIINKLENPSNSIVIFSAHGSDYRAIELAKSKGFEVYDLTCQYVDKTHILIKERLKDNYQIVFIGKANHPETNGILALSAKINLITSVKDCENLKIKDERILVTNQTTMSILDFYNIIKKLKNLYKNIEFINDMCDATLVRQEAVKKIDKTIDILIVVGDKKSNNSNKLVEMGKKKKMSSYLVEDKNDIDLNWFFKKRHIGITSGSSTPTKTTNEVIEFLKAKLNYEK